MTITIPISPETQRALEEQARAAGTDVGTFVAEAVRDRLAEPKSTGKLPKEQWLKVFDEWVSQLPPGNPNFDDSRESIYD